MKNTLRVRGAVLGAAAVLFLASCASMPMAAGLSIGETTAVALMAARSVDSTPHYEYRMNYPVFEAAPLLNNRIESIIQDAYNQFSSESAANWDAFEQVDAKEAAQRPPHQLFIDWTNKQINTDFISIYFNIYSYTGGANGMQQSQAVNYDCAAGAFLSLKDVLKPAHSDWLQKLSAEVRADLEQQFNPDGDALLTQMINAGTGPDANNFSVFVFDEYSVTIYFQKYQVAPGAYGMPSVVISRTGW